MLTYLPSILKGMILTLQLGLGGLLVAIFFGLIAALAKLSGNRLWVVLGTGYTTIIRGIPDLVLLFLIFYGGQVLLNFVLEGVGYKQFVEIKPLLAGILALGFIYGAYLGEVFRGAILSVPRGQSEAALAFGFSRFYTFRNMVLPQMVRFALPGFTNTWLVLLKTTALASLIGLADMTYLAVQAGAAARGEVANSYLVFLCFVGFIFLGITSVSLIVLRWLEKRYSVGVRRGAV